MRIIGLTGSIGMGKSTTAAMFRDLGVPVYDADAAVHALYAAGGEAVPLIEAAFPGTTGPSGVDRNALSPRVTADPGSLRRLEVIVHPLVAMQRNAFVQEAEAGGADIVLFDIPLLFESGGEALVDAVVVVTADAAVQRERVLARSGMTEEKLAAVLARQTPDAEKRSRADFVIDTGNGLDAAREEVAGVLAAVRAPDFKSRRERLDRAGEAGQ